MAYIGNGPGVASQRIVSTLTATDGQTSFTPTSGYTVGYVDVYLNGVKLISGTDFTASNGTNVVLTSGAATGDILEVVAYLPRGLSDGYTKAEADARYMDINAVTLPDQTGHSGQFLQSNGTTADWATVDLTQFAAPVQLKNYTTTERNALTGLESGDTIYNSTTGSIEFYDGATWIATNLIPTVTSVTNSIYPNIQSSLTVNATNATDDCTVVFTHNSVEYTVAGVNLSGGNSPVTTPSTLNAAVSGGDTVSVKILNADGTPSSNSVAKTVTILPIGGTITQSGTTVRHTFTSSSNFVVNSALTPTLEFHILGGGGGGAGGHDADWFGGGGGGAGGWVTKSSHASSAQSYSIVVGSGGSGGANASDGGGQSSAGLGSTGGDSSAFGYTAKGGGRGTPSGSTSYTAIGGCGGGTGADATHSSDNSSNQTDYGDAIEYGTAGGDGYSSGTYPYGGGGGGAGSAGGNAIAYHDGYNQGGGSGGTGRLYNGSYYAGGGGGGGAGDYGQAAGGGQGGPGGSSVGGNGGDITDGTTAVRNGKHATINTASGGGGGAGGPSGPTGTAGDGGNGSSGIVFVTYVLSDAV
jgi:hypothetical protein